MYRIALAYPYGDASNNQLYRGIINYAQEHPIFEFRFFAESSEEGLKELAAWKGDGAIVALQTELAFKQVADYDLPIVNLSYAINDSSVPRVHSDQEEIGTEAAQHLFNLGVNELAFVGASDWYYSKA